MPYNDCSTVQYGTVALQTAGACCLVHDQPGTVLITRFGRAETSQVLYSYETERVIRVND